MFIYVYMCSGTLRSQKKSLAGPTEPWLGNCEPLHRCGCWEQNSGSVQEHQAFLNTE